LSITQNVKLQRDHQKTSETPNMSIHPKWQDRCLLEGRPNESMWKKEVMKTKEEGSGEG
jgi:hypothetical protein